MSYRAAVWYNRTNAKWYAETYAENPNTAQYYTFLSSLGGDCTNFASQVVHYGGMAEMGAPNPGNGTYASWYYNGANVPDRSYSWTSAHWFRYHWANVNDAGYNRAYKYTVYTIDSALQNWSTIYYALWAGDIVQYVDYDGTTVHSQVIHDWAWLSDLRRGEIYFASHSTNYDGTANDGFYKYGSLYNYLKSKQNKGEGQEWFVTIQIRKDG